MDPVSALVSTISSLILTEAAKKFGGGLGEQANQTVGRVSGFIQGRFMKDGNEKAFKAAIENPGDDNKKNDFEERLIKYVEDDEKFRNEFKDLLNQEITDSLDQYLKEHLNKIKELLNRSASSKESSREVFTMDLRGADVDITGVGVQSGGVTNQTFNYKAEQKY